MIQIKSRYAGDVIFSADVETLKEAVEEAVSNSANLAGASLYGANLAGARLDGANLDGARLDGANLAGASLIRARLDGARLDGANLDGARLYGANLAGANLAGARLDGANLYGARLYGANLAGASLIRAKHITMKDNGVFQITPIGSRAATMVAFNTNKGIFIKTGCFFGELDEFAKAVEKTHNVSKHGKEYAAAIELVKIHFSECE